MVHNSTHLSSYLEVVARTSPGAQDSVAKTASDFVQTHVANFTHMDRISGLLVGEVQSGKTSQMFGIIAATADLDPGFTTFIILTTNNIALQRQTMRRALEQLATFNVCDEQDDMRYLHGGSQKPTLVVLKKDPNVLRSWRAHFAGNPRIAAGPIFVIDDEADNASPNTKVNSSEQSTIYGLLADLCSMGTSSIYLQVTATPQALILQSSSSGNRPSFSYYFPPGESYLGGRFFFTDPQPAVQVQIDENERADLLNVGSQASSGLKRAIATFLVTCAQFTVENTKSANFLVHPSVGKGDHALVRDKIEHYIRFIRENIETEEVRLMLFAAHQDLAGSCASLITFERLVACLRSELAVNVYLLNSSAESERDNDFSKGFNIVVGGNTLGRGVTFPKLQTVYYCRTSKVPQADTYWQHSRMFGYDRRPGLMRVFMPPSLFRAFRVFHEANELLMQQVRDGHLDSVAIVLPAGYRPTRKNVVDASSYSALVGGTNYFPANPDQSEPGRIGRLLEKVDDSREGERVDPDLLIKLLTFSTNDEPISWPVDAFVGAISTLSNSPLPPEFRLIVRRRRRISRNTGTLLSPDDRLIGSSFSSSVVVTAYELTGSKELGWDGFAFWILNIKLPAGKIFHRTR